MNNLEKLEKLLSEATAGKWFYDVAFGVRSDAPTSYNGPFQIATETLHRDGELICALRNAAPALIEVVKAAKAVTDSDGDDGGIPWADLYKALQKLEEVEI